jgi:hypothetical protein
VKHSERVVQGWCIDGLVVAKKSPGGRQWRIQIDAEDWPVETSLEERA